MASKKNKAVLKTVVGVAPTEADSPVYEDVTFELADETNVSAFGDSMSVDFLLKSIKASQQGIEKDHAAAKAANDTAAMKALEAQPIGIVIGKQALLMLLGQKECEGIRLYFCKNPWGKNSVAAVGVRVMRDSAGKPIIKDGVEVAQDIGVKDDATTILKSKNLSATILNVEVGPPTPWGGG